MTSSESPTHPDAPRAGGETPPMDIDETRDLLLHAAEVLRCHAADSAVPFGIECGCADVAQRLDRLRASLLARHRDGERAEPAASPGVSEGDTQAGQYDAPAPESTGPAHVSVPPAASEPAGTNGRMCVLEPGHDGPHKAPPVEPDIGSDL